MNATDAYLAHLVDDVEGGTFTDDPADPGGPTRWGITQRTLSAYRGHPVTAVDVQALTRTEALDIYRADYVIEPGFDKLAEISSDVALEVIDTGVNMGVGTAARYLQRCLNVLGSALKVDGQCGPKTVADLDAYIRRRGVKGQNVLVMALNCLQGADYIRLAETDAADRKWVFGWLSQRVLQNVRDWT
ncbi:MAG TPA: glycosyl hydrolase 108 family protein [Rhodanobacteraceae bacterium]|nr:glycosyl hydrolase 108 family protein [Rhodanobacteraceae bacterium]